MVLTVVAAVLIQSAWERTLSDGAKLKFVAVSDDLRQISWSPDGAKLAKWISSFSGSTPPEPNPDNILTVVVMIDNRKGSDFPNVKMAEGTRKVNQSASVGYYDFRAAPHSPYLATGSRPFPIGKETFNLRVGCANGAWKTVSTYDVASKNTKGISFFPRITFHNKPTPRDRNSIEVDIKIDKTLGDGNTNYRIVAFAANGKKLSSSGSTTRRHESGPSEFWFTRFDHKVARLELQTRKYDWFDFIDVRAIPNK